MTDQTPTVLFHRHSLSLPLWGPAVRSVGVRVSRAVAWAWRVVLAVVVGVRGAARGVARGGFILAGLAVGPIGVWDLAGRGWALIVAVPVLFLAAWVVED